MDEFIPFLEKGKRPVGCTAQFVIEGSEVVRVFTWEVVGEAQGRRGWIGQKLVQHINDVVDWDKQ